MVGYITTDLVPVEPFSRPPSLKIIFVLIQYYPIPLPRSVVLNYVGMLHIINTDGKLNEATRQVN